MTPPGTDRPGYERITRALVGLLMIGTFGFMCLGSLWGSRIPQYGLLALFGEEASATIVDSEVVHYASFPYDGVVHLVEFRTLDGERRHFERSGDYVPAGLGGVFSVHYLPLWPSVVLIDEEPRLSFLSLGFGMFTLAVFAVFLAVGRQEGEQMNVFLRPVLWVGDAIVAGLERLWTRFRVDDVA